MKFGRKTGAHGADPTTSGPKPDDPKPDDPETDVRAASKPSGKGRTRRAPAETDEAASDADAPERVEPITGRKASHRKGSKRGYLDGQMLIARSEEHTSEL